MPAPTRLLAIQKETEVEWTFRLEADAAPNFGQFYMVSLPRIGEVPFSISGVGEGWIDMTIRNVGKVTSKIHDLAIGDTLFIRGPYGNGFPLEEFKGQHLVIAAGGSGVAPVRPLVEYYYKNQDQVEKLDLLFGFRDPESVLFREDIDRWSETFETILTVDKACGIWDGECVGLITEYAKHVKLSEYPKMEILIVGPPIMMKFTAAEFLKRNVPEERIIVSMERHMSCGIGKCGHCKVEDCYVCLDGPVFRYHDAIRLID
jgi:anaerobic sulfite reductase subunit B